MTAEPQGGVWAGCPYCRRYVRLRHVTKTVPVASQGAGGEYSLGVTEVTDPELIAGAMALHARGCAS